MKSVVICGSRRFKEDVKKFAVDLRKLGITVFEPFMNTNESIKELPEDLKKYALLGLTWHHIEFIRKAEVVFIFNKDGYMGCSSTLELGAAAALCKPIYALEAASGESCRDILFDEIVKTPQELLEFLR